MTPPKWMTPYDIGFANPINAMLRNDLAMQIRPDAPKKLLEHGHFESRLIYGSLDIFPSHSYVYNAILYNRPAVLAWVLECGAKPDDIENIFASIREYSQCLRRHSWLTMAVELGRTTCVEVLLEYAKDTFNAATSRDGAERSAIDLARSFPGTLHPRIPSLRDDLNLTTCGVLAADDASVLTLLEAVVGITSTSPPTIKSGFADKVRLRHTDMISLFLGRPSTHSSNLPTMLTHPATLLTAITHLVEYIDHFVSTGALPRTFNCIKDQFNQFWQMSSLEALLVRLSFLIAYCILFCYHMISFTTYLTSLSGRSDFRLVIKICVAALICYYLHFLKPDETA